MSATNYTPIQLYRSSTSAAAPVAGNLAFGELALNYTDEKMYFKNAAGTVTLLASAASVALASTSVQLTGNQTVAGTKTFSSPISGSVTGSSGSCTGAAATVSPDGVTTVTILNSAVTTDKINNFAVTTAKVANANITAGKLDGAQSGFAPIYGARAWVNFDGTGTVAIRASGNVSSITDNGTGDYTVNFSTGMSDEKYSVVGLCQRPDTNNDIALTIPYASLGGAYSATAVRLVTTSMTASWPGIDASIVSVAIHR